MKADGGIHRPARPDHRAILFVVAVLVHALLLIWLLRGGASTLQRSLPQALDVSMFNESSPTATTQAVREPAATPPMRTAASPPVQPRPKALAATPDTATSANASPPMVNNLVSAVEAVAALASPAVSSPASPNTGSATNALNNTAPSATAAAAPSVNGEAGAAGARQGVSIDARYAASNPVPPYPPLARRLGEQGTVVLRILVTTDGRADRVEIKKSSGSPTLDRSAETTLKQWRFIPAKIDGKPVEEWYETRWTFKLEG